MYLVEGRSPSEIAHEIGAKTRQIQNMASQRGWAALRKKQLMELEATTSDEAISRLAQEEIDDFSRSVATQSEELTERAFRMGRQAETPFDLNQSASAAQKLVQLNRLVLGLDRKDQQQSGPVSISFFVAAPIDRPKDPAVIDIQEADSGMDLEFLS